MISPCTSQQVRYNTALFIMHDDRCMLYMSSLLNLVLSFFHAQMVHSSAGHVKMLPPMRSVMRMESSRHAWKIR